MSNSDENNIDKLMRSTVEKYKDSPAALIIHFYEIIDCASSTFLRMFRENPSLLIALPAFQHAKKNPQNYPDAFLCKPILDFFIKELTIIKQNL
jgi:hypothetical protein